MYTPLSASDASEPRLGMGMETPRPRKLKKLSVNIADGICSAVVIIITLMQLGRMCRRMMRKELAPMDLAVRTYSSCFTRESRSYEARHAHPVKQGEHDEDADHAAAQLGQPGARDKRVEGLFQNNRKQYDNKKVGQGVDNIDDAHHV